MSRQVQCASCGAVMAPQPDGRTYACSFCHAQVQVAIDGPRASHNLIRIIRPDGSLYENVVDLRQNQSIDLVNNLSAEGTYTWYVYPLDENYVQIPCHEGGPWTFMKALSPTITPTLKAGP